MSKTMKAAIVLQSLDHARPAISAANALDAAEVEVWVFGQLTEEMHTLPVDAILSVEAGGDLVAERYLDALEQLKEERSPDIYLFAGSAFADELAAQFGAMTGAGTALSITGARTGMECLIITRRVYGLQLEAELAFHSLPCVFSLAKACFSPTEGQGSPRIIESSAALRDVDWYRDAVVKKAPREKSLTDYNRMLIGGRGLGSAAAAEDLEALGAAMEAGVGGTRPAVLSGWLPYERMIGLSGTVITPELCVTFGVSGCAPFLKGVEKSECLVAINHDPNALIFRHCDIGIVAGCGEIIAALRRLAAGDKETG